MESKAKAQGSWKDAHHRHGTGARLLSLSPEVYGQIVEYAKWHHPSSMDTMESKAMAFKKYITEHMATAEE